MHILFFGILPRITIGVLSVSSYHRKYGFGVTVGHQHHGIWWLIACWNPLIKAYLTSRCLPRTTHWRGSCAPERTFLGPSLHRTCGLATFKWSGNTMPLLQVHATKVTQEPVPGWRQPHFWSLKPAPSMSEYVICEACTKKSDRPTQPVSKTSPFHE